MGLLSHGTAAAAKSLPSYPTLCDPIDVKVNWFSHHWRYLSTVEVCLCLGM